MILDRLMAGGTNRVRCVASAAFVLFVCATSLCAESFPFDQELLLDAPPMRPGKRMPVLTVEPSGNARIDLWCKTVNAHVEISEAGVKVEAGPLPEELPTMQSAGQCSPERVQADEELLATFTQATGWRWDGNAIVLEGPTVLRLRPSDH